MLLINKQILNELTCLIIVELSHIPFFFPFVLIASSLVRINCKRGCNIFFVINEMISLYAKHFYTNKN